MKYTNQLGKYIQENDIDINQIEKELGIETDVLSGKVSKRALKADEFLEVCSFLHIDPERLF